MKKNLGENISSFCSNHGIHIIAIAETKSDRIPCDKSNHVFGFQNHDFIPCLGKSGGIWLLWNSKQIKITILVKEVRFLSVLISGTINHVEFGCIFAYAPPKVNFNNQFWKDLSEYCQNSTNFVVLGDLNEIECQEDKSGGINPSQDRFTRLAKFQD